MPSVLAEELFYGKIMPRRRFKIGLLFSTTGPYSTVARSMLNGALLGVSEVNASKARGLTLEPVIMDPAGMLARYAEITTELLVGGIRQIVGCYTSISRKEVIPCLEKHDGLLWYPSHYEGFETANNVVYTGAAPNQHILPLVDYLTAQYGDRALCVGSNYIWAWENNRILREAMVSRGGTVLAERYLPVGDTNLAQLIEMIIKARPSFVFSSLIGDSGYAFFRQFRAACQKAGIDQALTIPVASCNLSEPELGEVGKDAVDGHISSSVYFSTLRNPVNDAFVRDYAAMFPDQPISSADAEASYIAVKLLAAALEEAETDEVAAVKTAVSGKRLHAPQGEVLVDGQTLHCYLTPRIGRSNVQGLFDIVMDAGEPVRPDPYLVNVTPTLATSPTVHPLGLEHPWHLA